MTPHRIVQLTFIALAACGGASEVREQTDTDAVLTGAGLEIQANAIKLDTTATTHSVQLYNPSAASVSGVSITIDVPAPGADIITSPAGSIATCRGNAITWSLANVAANTSIGPFVMRATRETSPGNATVSWSGPTRGSTVLAYSGKIEDATIARTSANMASTPDASTPGKGLMFAPAGGATMYRALGSEAAPTRSNFLTPISSTGIRYFVPAGDRGVVNVSRSTIDPSATSGLTFVGG